MREKVAGMTHPDLAGMATTDEARDRRLRSFRANVEKQDAEVVAFCRDS